MTEESYPTGIDCVWLALDQDGFVAAFSAGGSGPIPVRRAIGAIDERIEQLPRTSTAWLFVSLKRADHFVGIAERGIFAYDWSDVHRTKRDEIGAYELIAAPSNPIKLEQLPHDMVTLVANSRLEGVTFETANRLDVRKSLNCVEAP